MEPFRISVPGAARRDRRPQPSHGEGFSFAKREFGETGNRPELASPWEVLYQLSFAAPDDPGSPLREAASLSLSAEGEHSDRRTAHARTGRRPGAMPPMIVRIPPTDLVFVHCGSGADVRRGARNHAKADVGGEVTVP
jgi:hypothetical protein